MRRSILYIASAMLFTAAGSRGQSATAVDGRAALREIEAKAASAASEADMLERASRDVRLSWETHRALLNRIRDDINLVGKQIGDLDSERESLAPREREALTTVLPLLADAAGNTNQAIDFLNGNLAHLWATGSEGTRAGKIEEDCSQAAKLLRGYLELDRAEQKQTHQGLRLESGS